MESGLMVFVILCGIMALLFAFTLIKFILRQPDGNQKVKEIAEQIHLGAMTFLNKEYKIIFNIANSIDDRT